MLVIVLIIRRVIIPALSVLLLLIGVLKILILTEPINTPIPETPHKTISKPHNATQPSINITLPSDKPLVKTQESTCPMAVIPTTIKKSTLILKHPSIR